MSFGREKRLLLGVLALLAPVPLPLNAVVAWPTLALYLALVVVFLRRAWRDPGSWLPPWAMNALGLAYLPLLYLDLVVLWGGQLVRPVIHLAMFTVVVKLFALRHERDKWHVLGGAFFLFLASMGTSVHPSIMLYLLAFVALALALLTRFSYYSVLARFGYRGGELARVPLGGFLATATLGVVLVGVPLFALLPRIRTPYLTVRGAGTGTVVHAAGFSDLITLDSIGSARGNRQIVLRMQFEPQPQPRSEIRLRAATYERYDGRTWRATTATGTVAPSEAGVFRLADQPPRQRAEMWLLPWSSNSLPVPVQALAVHVPRAPALARDAGGALSLYFLPGGTFRYDVDLADEPVFDLVAEPELTGDDAILDARGATPRVARLAADVMGQGAPLERAQRLERHLQTSYRYTTDFVGRSGQMPLERFLFDRREGHCEFFATAMVVMLRSQGIPARLVTGFLGGEPNALEGYYVVRQSNAHAWVEAWIPGVGWRLFDPTPAAGRPGAAESGISQLASQVWDYLLFRWDRYVLTFGFYDQVQILMRARSLWSSFWKLFEREKAAEVAAEPSAADLGELTTAEAAAGSGWQEWVPRAGAALGLVAVALVAFWLWRRSRRPPSATEVYRRLRERLERRGAVVPPSLAPLRLLRQTAARYPAAAQPTGELVQLYLRESFAGEELSAEDLGTAARSLQEVERVLAKAG